jgi:hypothetical protein
MIYFSWSKLKIPRDAYGLPEPRLYSSSAGGLQPAFATMKRGSSDSIVQRSRSKFSGYVTRSAWQAPQDSILSSVRLRLPTHRRHPRSELQDLFLSSSFRARAKTISELDVKNKQYSVEQTTDADATVEAAEHMLEHVECKQAREAISSLRSIEGVKEGLPDPISSISS